MSKNTININGSNKSTYAHAEKENDVIYVPITELEDVYGIEIKYIENSKSINNRFNVKRTKERNYN